MGTGEEFRRCWKAETQEGTEPADRLRVSRCETKIKTKINEIEKRRRTWKGAGEEGAGSQNRRGRGPRGGRRAGQ